MEKRHYQVIVLINAVDGRDDELTDWFVNTHIPDALKVSGYVDGQLFKLTKEQREGSKPQWNYLALYTLDTDDLQGVIDELKRRANTPLMIATDTIAPDGLVSFFQPVSEKQFAEAAGGTP